MAFFRRKEKAEKPSEAEGRLNALLQKIDLPGLWEEPQDAGFLSGILPWISIVLQIIILIALFLKK